MRVIFMGTPDFSVPALQALIDSDHDVIAVYTQPPRPKGRGMQMHQSPVHALAERYGLDVYTPTSLRKDIAEQTKFAALNADIAVVAAYGLLLPTAVLNAPAYGCINIHASLLPRWRGASPIQHAIWKGDDTSGITIMKMDEGLDTGDMILKQETPITATTTAQDLHDALSAMGGEMVLTVLHEAELAGRINGAPQDDSLSNYAPLLKKTDGEIDLAQSPIAQDRHIRALNPWPGTYINGLKGRVKILQAHVDDNQIIYDLVQPEGKKPMDYQSAKNGGYV